jgi:hypothetical protein
VKRERGRLCGLFFLWCNDRAGSPVHTEGRTLMPDPLKLTPSLRAILQRIADHSGSLSMLAVTASGRSEKTS